MDGTYPRRALPTYQTPDLDEFIRSGFPRPGQAGWAQLTDAHVLVGGFNATARRHIVRQLLFHVDKIVARQPAQRDHIDLMLGTLEACHIVRHLLKGGKWTWDAKRYRSRGNLQEIVEELAYPPRLPKRLTPDRVIFARRKAFEALYGFAVDVPCRKLAHLLAPTLPMAYLRKGRSNEPTSPRQLQWRIGQVLRFYGAGEPSRTGARRSWRLYPWRLWVIDHEFEHYGDVCLDLLQWRPASHFLPTLESSLAHWRRSSKALP